MEKRNEPKSVRMICASMLIFGTIGLLRRYLPVSSALLACVRGLLGGLFLLAFRLLRGKRTAKLPQKTAWLLALSGAMMGFNWVLLFEAYRHTTVAVATLCYYMAPTIVVLLSPLLFGEKLTARRALCALAAIGGMALVTGAGRGGAGSPLGIAFGLAAACLYAAVVILNKKTPGADVFEKTTIQLFAAGLAVLPYLLLSEGFNFGALGGRELALLAVAGLVHTGVAYLLYFGSMDGLRAQSAAMLSYLDPVFALLLSAFFLKEPMSVSGLIGAVLILGAACIGEITPKKE